MSEQIPLNDASDPPVYGTTYRLNIDACDAMTRAALKRRLITLSIVSVCAVVGFNALTTAVAVNKRPVEESFLPVIVTLLITAVLFGVMAPLQFRRIRREHEAWASYELTIGHQAILRTYKDLPPLSIARSQVTGLREHPENGLTITTADPLTTLVVPRTLDRYQDARERLLKWRPLDKSAMSKNNAIETALGIVLLIAWPATALLMISPWGLIPAALTMMLGFRQLHRLLKNPNVTPQQKRAGTLLVGFIISAPASMLAFVALRNFLSP